MILNVFVREQVLPIQVGDGDQTIKWLSTVACFRYAEAHDFAWDVNQFIPVHAADAKHRTLLPNNKLKDCNLDNSEVHIEVLGPHIGPNDPKTRREKSLWERYAYAAEDEWVKITFRYDLESENGGSTSVTSAVPDEHTGTDQRSRDMQLKKKLQKQLKAAPELVGNFTGWDNPIRMHPERIDNHESNTRYMWEDVFPYGSQLVFKFIVNDVEVCGKGYDVVKDSSGEEVNYLRIRPPAHSYSELQSPRGVTQSDNPVAAVDSMLNARPQNFESVRSMTPEMRAQLFEQDWKKMQFADKVRTKKERDSIKELLREHFEELRMIFQYFSCHGAGDIIHMNMMEFAYFCHTCRIPDKHVTMATIDQVFRRVNIEEEFDEKAIEENPGNYRNAMKIVPDPYNPDNQFIRGEFLEALIRLAMKKYPVQDACTATQRLLREHVLAYALDASFDDIRKYLLDPAVQRVYRKYSRRLNKLYQKQCRLDSKDPDTTTMSIREFEMLLEEFKLIDENVSRRAALAAFALSQDATTEDTDNYKMVYGEFLEALGRIAFEKYNKPEMTLADKLEALCQILFSS